MHLDHKRGYVTEEMLDRSMEIRLATRRNRTVRASLGIEQYL